MTRSSRLLLAVVPLLICAMIKRTEAFGLISAPIKPILRVSPSFAIDHPTRHRTALCAEKEEVEDEAEEEVTSESTDESSDTDTDEAEGDDAVEPEVDPEVKELKDKISQMESTLKQKNRDLSKLQDLCDDYSSGGFARKVAEMEGYRRSKKAASADSNLVARAIVLQSFLPILDDLKSKGEVYADDEFAQKYAALGSDFSNCLTNLGVSEYTVAEGENINSLRTNTVEEEFSDSIAKGCVIAPVRLGYELKGNVMRMADVVVSLGSEAETSEEAGDDSEDNELDENEEETASEGKD